MLNGLITLIFSDLEPRHLELGAFSGNTLVHAEQRQQRFCRTDLYEVVTVKTKRLPIIRRAVAKLWRQILLLPSNTFVDVDRSLEDKRNIQFAVVVIKLSSVRLHCPQIKEQPHRTQATRIGGPVPFLDHIVGRDFHPDNRDAIAGGSSRYNVRLRPMSVGAKQIPKALL